MIEERFIIIGRSNCPFCSYAVDYCKAAKVEYKFLDYIEKEEILQEYKNFYKQDTVPIILSNNLKTGFTKKVGGYSELLEYTAL